MQNITRTMSKFHVRALDLVDNEQGEPEVKTIAECDTCAFSLNKGAARAALSEATGEKIPRGVMVKWDKTGSITYAMPLDEFLEGAIIIEEA